MCTTKCPEYFPRARRSYSTRGLKISEHYISRTAEYVFYDYITFKTVLRAHSSPTVTRSISKLRHFLDAYILVYVVHRIRVKNNNSNRIIAHVVGIWHELFTLGSFGALNYAFYISKTISVLCNYAKWRIIINTWFSFRIQYYER